MAIATLTIEDVDVHTGELKISSNIEGSLVDDGQMTAAEVMLRLLINEISDPAFRQKMWQQAATMVEGSDAKIANTEHKPEEAA